MELNCEMINFYSCMAYQGSQLYHTAVHENISDEEMNQGFIELKTGQEICIVSTGFMTHKAMDLIQKSKLPIGLIDLFLIKGLDKIKLAKLIQKYKKVITIEEGFINKGWNGFHHCRDHCV